MKNSIGKVVGGVFLAAGLTVTAWSVPTRAATTATTTTAEQNNNIGNPGALNYIEGQASIGSEVVNSKAIGSANLQPGQSLNTGNGKAEVLLTPGVFLRLGDHSTVKMVSPDLTNTQVEVQKGEATVEVAELHPENDLRVTEDGVTTQLVKRGFYDFDADQGWVRVIEGEAMVLRNNGKRVKVDAKHQVNLREANGTNGPLKARGFDVKAYEANNDLYKWSSLRSAYVAEANVNDAPMYAYNGPYAGWYGDGWVGAGWYWDPWFSCYTFIPGDGIFYSPFGWGFYSPWYVGYAPLYGYGFYGYGGGVRHFRENYNAWGPGVHYPGLAGRGAGAVGAHGFAGGMHAENSGGGFHGGGFSGGGGFHGGGGGGGFGGGHGR